ncbi:pathogenesis-related protein PRB1-3-like [Oryza glaberrima]|uniref:pathogenesis-related protein PRB1-3-like n=1 Tax=Oryza glaberrima TaxID=4538 RepID=UPI00224BF052|nr:pathogenesis-related protein PRB1-3-like [Oryza glaberrima]
MSVLVLPSIMQPVARAQPMAVVAFHTTCVDVLAVKALEHARYCRKQHIPGKYGENPWWSSVGGSTGTPAEAMSYWVGERPYYDYRSNSCIGGHQCGHYTQVVWRRTAYVGCARVTCNTNNGIGTIIACNYYPRGNIYNERPY